MIKFINMMLVTAIVITLLFLVNQRYEMRKKFTILGKADLKTRQLNIEYSRLLIEEATYENRWQLRSYAIDKLGMQIPSKVMSITDE